MKYVVYLDVFLIVNILMDFLILIIAKRLIKPQTTILRCIIATIIGGVLSVLSLMIPYKTIWLRFITSYILICFVMVIIAFQFKCIRDSIRNILVVYAITFMLGGIMNVLYYKAPVTLKRFVAVSLMAYVVCSFLCDWITRKKAGEKLYKVHIYIKEKSVSVTALLDTGNLLFDPISGRKVHIIEYETIKDIINKENGFYRVIPYNSVGNSRGLLNAIEADCMEIENGEGAKIRVDKPLIALYDKKLASDGRFEGLLHSSISELI